MQKTKITNAVLMGIIMQNMPKQDVTMFQDNNEGYER